MTTITEVMKPHRDDVTDVYPNVSTYIQYCQSQPNSTILENVNGKFYPWTI